MFRLVERHDAFLDAQLVLFFKRIILPHDLFVFFIDRVGDVRYADDEIHRYINKAVRTITTQGSHGFSFLFSRVTHVSLLERRHIVVEVIRSRYVVYLKEILYIILILLGAKSCFDQGHILVKGQVLELLFGQSLKFLFRKLSFAHIIAPNLSIAFRAEFSSDCTYR